MNPIALYLASGESLYLGAAILLLIVILSHWVRGKWTQRLWNLAAVIGLAMFLVACAPFSWISYVLIVAAWLAWFIAWNRSAIARSAQRVRVGTAVVLAGIVAIHVGMELDYRWWRALPVEHHNHLLVIGDSISAGIGGRHRPWPLVFQTRNGIAVTNLSRPGIGVAEAIDLVKGINAADTLVLIELGGNDLLGDVSPADFERDLDRVLGLLAHSGRTLVMFELPLLPHKISFGRVQRRLAGKYHVHLIPKRLFIGVMAGADATSDGLHLSDAGAERMSELIERLLGPVLLKNSPTGL